MITERKALEINIENWTYYVSRWEARKQKRKLTKKQEIAYKEDLRKLERFKHKLSLLDE